MVWAVVVLLAYTVDTFGVREGAVDTFGVREGASRPLLDGGRARAPRTLYLVSTGAGKKAEKKVRAVRTTWGARLPRGSDVLFFSHAVSESQPVIVVEGAQCARKCLGRKELLMWQWVLDNNATYSLLRDFDFFVHTDDDTLVLPWNMARFLRTRRADVPAYLGHRFGPSMSLPRDKTAATTGDDIRLFNSGGAGYVLSRATLELVAAAPYHRGSGVRQDFKPAGRGFDWCMKAHPAWANGAGDTAIARCLLAFGVVAGETRDAALRPRFHFVNPAQVFELSNLFGAGRSWVDEYEWYGWRDRGECCSVHSVSFHYVQPSSMLGYDALLYPRNSRPLAARRAGCHVNGWPRCSFSARWSKPPLFGAAKDCVAVEAEGKRRGAWMPLPVSDCLDEKTWGARRAAALANLVTTADWFTKELQWH
eukprot:g1748.t1